MARLSTGQSYGDTNRSTAAQLLGGIPVDASSGAIAQATINEPALRPQAAPVSTFQQVGAPTLGGPVKFFAPPDLPEPSKDLARIAAALGGFSPILENLGQGYIQRKKEEDARAQMAGQGVAQQLQLTAPGQDFITARDNLERKAQAGDPGALAAFQQLQALSPLQQAYAQRYAGQAVLREDIGTALDRFNAVPEIDGVPIDKIPPGDPRLSAFKASLYRLPVNDPAGFAELMPLIAAKNGEIDRAHMALHTAHKDREAGAATQATTVSLFSGKPVAADVAAGITNQLNAARQNLGIEQYQKHLQAVPDMLVAAVMANSRPDGKPDANKFLALASVADEAFAQIRVGPNGEASLLDSYGAKGGAAMQLDLQLKLLAKNKELTTAVDTFAGSIGENEGHRIVAALKIDDPGLTPSQRDARMVQAGTMTAQIADPLKRKAAESVVSSAYNSAQQFFTRPAQAEAERNVVFSYDKDPATEIKYIQGLVRSGLMAPEAGNRVIANYRSLQQADMRPMVDASRNAVNLAMEAEMNLVKDINSEGGMTITKRETQFLIERKAELTGSVEAMRRKALADGSGVAGYRAQLDAFTKALLPQAAKPINPNLTPTFKSPEQWRQTVNPMGRGRQQDNDRLRQQVDSGRVMTEPEFNKNFTAWVERGEMSDAMKLMIKHSGYGAKPSEFWRKQWSNQYNGAPMDPKYEQAIPLRDQMKVSYQPDTSGPSTQLASNLSSFWQNLANASMNAVMPPAAAATMPTRIPGQWSNGPAVQASNAETGNGWTVPGLKDEKGRPPIFTQEGANAFAAMVSASGGQVKATDIASSQRTPGKNAAVGGVEGSQHLSGNAMDIHGTSIAWIRKNGAKYGWYVNDYPGSHGGHVEFRGGGGGSQQIASLPATRKGGGMTGVVTFYSGGGGQDGVAGGLTATGEKFDPNAMTAAIQWSLRDKYLGKNVVVEDLDTGKKVKVKINDVGPMGGDEKSLHPTEPRIMDLSQGAFRALYGSTDRGKGRIRITLDNTRRS
jgi:hypothetical protein